MKNKTRFGAILYGAVLAICLTVAVRLVSSASAFGRSENYKNQNTEDGGIYGFEMAEHKTLGQALLQSDPKSETHPDDSEPPSAPVEINNEYAPSYIISGEGDDLTLSRYDEGVPTVIARGTLSALFSSIDGGRVVFNGVNSASGAQLSSGKYVFSGELSISGTLTVSQEVELTLSEFTLNHSASGAMVRVKGGELTVENSTLKSQLGSVVLDYLAESRLTLSDGCIFTEKGEYAVDIKLGAARLLSGSVIAESGIGVRNDSSLILGEATVLGAEYGIETQRPVTLADKGPTQNVRILYNAPVSSGTLTELFYNARQAYIEELSVYGSEGNRYTLTYFESYSGIEEKNFLAIYLPYTVRYFVEGVLYNTENKLVGENPTLAPPKIPRGYTFTGWSSGGEKVSGDFEISGNLDLGAELSLVAPGVFADNLRATYDGTPHTVKLTLSHPLDNEGGRYSFEWFKDGILISTSEQISVSRVGDSGEYSCKVTFSHKTRSVSVFVPSISVSILPASVTLPKAEPKYYNGELQFSGLSANHYYNVTDLGAINAGRYSVILELSDKENFVFENGGTTAEISFEILRAKNTWQLSPRAFDVYEGQAPKIEAKSAYGVPVYRFSSKIDGEFTEELPKSIGIHYLTVTVPESKNYEGLVSPPIPFEIIKESIVGLEIISQPTKTTYTAFDSFCAAGVLAKAKYNSGREEQLSAEKLSVSYQSADTFRFGDNAVILSYLGVFARVDVTVNRAAYDISGIDFSDEEKIFCGDYLTPEPEFPDIIGHDGLPLGYKLVGGGKDVGEYRVTLVFLTDSTNYELPESIEATLKILPKQVSLVWENTAFIYDGTVKMPTAYYTDVRGVRRTARISGGATEAADGYLATAELADKNYIPENPSTHFSVLKAKYDISEVEWIYGDFVYSGEEYSVVLRGLPDGITLVGYSGGRAKNAGKYKAEAIIVYDERNFEPPKIPTLEWTVSPAEYDMSSIRFESVTAEYDGKLHYPTIVGEMPVGFDGSSPDFSLSNGACHATDGEVTVTLSFVSNSPNYYAPKPLYATVKITPKPIAVLWDCLEMTFCGEELLPKAESPVCGISVLGAAVDAGEYTAFAISDDPDYTVSNSEMRFVIKKAENAWLTLPEIKNIYESGSLSPIAKAKSGEPSFTFYLDAECTAVCQAPSIHGIYYAIATVPESKNYYELSSPLIKFEIIEVVSVGISAELLWEEPVALQTVPPELITVCVFYNDGTKTGAQSEIVISYQNGNALTAADEYITVSTLGHFCKIAVNVKKADYDMSGVVWLNTEVEYNGLPQSPELEGLPLGVTVCEYNLAPVTNAGKYTFLAYLSYDSENYNAPTAPPCEFTVKKCVVTPPTDKELIYNGKPHSLFADKTLYEIADHACKDAGKYTLTARVSDKENYEFPGGVEEWSFELTVTPKVLVYSAPDYEVYLFDDPITPSVTFLSGEIAEGDEVSYAISVENGSVVLRSTNPNYRLQLIGGKLTEYNYPSPETVVKIALTALLVLILLLMLVLAFLGREKILHTVRTVRVKRKTNFEKNETLPQRNLSDSTSATQDNGEKPTAATTLAVTDSGTAENILTATREDRTENTLTTPRKDTVKSTLAETDKGEETDAQATDRGATDSGKTDISTASAESASGEKPISDKHSVAEGGNEYSEKPAADNFQIPESAEPSQGVDMDKADSLITDSLAKDLIKKGRETVVTEGVSQGIINVDTLSRSFSAGERVDLNALKEKKLVSADVAYLKVLARGYIDKPLIVLANDFSLSAVKMIALTGGEAIKVTTVVKK